MSYQNTEIPLKEIIKVFKQINVKDILSIAKNIQKRLTTDKSLILKGNTNKYKLVTQADIEIQKLLLDYFDNSSLKGTYKVFAEETIQNNNNSKNTSWKLIIDPLDGTSSFKKQNKMWGVMVGAIDNKGILRYSWNLISTGEIYTSGYKGSQKISFKNKIAKEKLITIDVYDYGSFLSNKFKDAFKINFNIENDKIVQTSYPAAVWAGYKLFTNCLDGLLWLPSNKGKKSYPGYDLIFLGALLDKGYNVIIGKTDTKNCMIVVAPVIEDAEKLYKVGLDLLPADKKIKMEKLVNTLNIDI
ncbi:hypothetical protein COY87_00180 [Candidatus Roizmanbacteria bacterium CG_4_10_14_0_8_um_filter_33_9]|uniref:Uncharacterized protein n=1 Tax=Candidatus Roizmanbacteria bacterium CG_4_10_14_0_8_um_filter_33_9 TaxID=1974826 RepID=A0A2M7QKX1_9BACT|nr:MAG: hypothetical protein COY87_00180 [Candidatus Roizmanbacteria bacterium CG_4_10_14_0_8_um_filter_33_9]